MLIEVFRDSYQPTRAKHIPSGIRSTGCLVGAQTCSVQFLRPLGPLPAPKSAFVLPVRRCHRVCACGTRGARLAPKERKERAMLIRGRSNILAVSSNILLLTGDIYATSFRGPRMPRVRVPRPGRLGRRLSERASELRSS